MNCIEDTCERPTYALGRCKYHYERKRRGLLKPLDTDEPLPWQGSHKFTLIGERIMLLRRERRLKMTALAELSGVAVNTVSRMVWKSAHAPSLPNIEKVATALGVEVWELFMDAPLKEDDAI